MSDLLASIQAVSKAIQNSNKGVLTSSSTGAVGRTAKFTDTVFHQDGTRFTVQPRGNRGLDHDNLPGGNYTVKFSPMIGFYLEAIAEFPEMKKLYGDALPNAKRILNTYRTKNGNLGVLLDGLKGSGKTLLARLISILAAKEGIPTLIINSPLTGENFFHFLYSIQQECIVFFDEFEKVYDDKEQESLLTVLDGTFPSKKLFLLTSNDKTKINQHLKNRPGRIHYYLNFKGLSGEFIREFVEDNLVNKEHEKELLSICSMFTSMNFDSLATMVWEMNLYKEPAGKAIAMLNTKPEDSNDQYYDVSFKFKDCAYVFSGDFIQTNKIRGNPLKADNQMVVPLIPAVLSAAAKMLNLPEDEVYKFNPEAFDNTKRIFEANDQRNKEDGTTKKVSWNDHDYIVRTHYAGQVSVPLVALYLEIGDEMFAEASTKFEPSDLTNIDVDTKTYTFHNKLGSVLTMKQVVVQEHSALDYLKYMA
jgi:predicted AAA+ superfamily ATPase